MNFRVFEMETNEDVTMKQEWFIDTDGDLRYITSDKNEVGFPLAIANACRYYYKLEIEVV